MVEEQPLLALRNVSKSFGGVNAVQGITFDVGAGESVGLVGPNGAGKTTLFNCVCGQLRNDGGSIEFEGRSLRGLPTYKRARLGIGRTYQRAEVFADMTVRDHLMVAERARSRTGRLWKDLCGMSRPTDEECDKVDSTMRARRAHRAGGHARLGLGTRQLPPGRAGPGAGGVNDPGLFATFGLPQTVAAAAGPGTGPMTPAARRAWPADGARLLEPSVSSALAQCLAVTPEIWPRPTPCRDWDLRMLLRHACESLAAFGEGIEAGRVGLDPAAEDGDLAADPARAFRDRCLPAAGRLDRPRPPAPGRRHRRLPAGGQRHGRCGSPRGRRPRVGRVPGVRTAPADPARPGHRPAGDSPGAGPHTTSARCSRRRSPRRLRPAPATGSPPS